MLKTFLFWFHVGVGLAGVALGAFLSLPVIITLVIAHRLHILLFRGCAISRLQQVLGHFPRQVNFLQVVSRKFFKRDITSVQVRIFDYSLGLTPIIIATIRYF